MDYDVIVIGIGGMGSAAVYHLARKGVRVLGLEQYDIPHDRGSSHGVNRIIRLGYAEHPSYVPLLRRAYELWRELEAACGEQLLFITGGFDIGPRDGTLVSGVLRSCALHGLQYELMEPAAVNDRYPGFRLIDPLVGVFQPDSGFVLAERSVIAHVEAAHARGADVRARETVLDWEASDAGVRVRTNRGRYRAKRLVITAGPWASSVVPALRTLTVAERQVLLFAQPLRPELYRLGRFPIFNMDAAEGHFYGLPIHGVPGVKIGKYHHLHQQGAPDALDRDVHDEDERVLRDAIARYFPDANGPTMALKTCLFTNSPDEHFIIDRHPHHASVFIAAGFSGHGFKFCSVVGEILAELAVDGATRHDLSLFRLSRFGSQTSIRPSNP
ncbi:MAG TPA: N-methyl-L-tryptophan oxidase [Vicinamibacterales bacterium]|jgi:sarcosine oxidase